MSRQRSKAAARLGTLGALVAPFLVVQAGRMFFNGQMSQAPAAPVTAVPLLFFTADGAQVSLSAPDKNALEWITRQRSQAGAAVESPMDRTAAKPAPRPPPDSAGPSDPPVTAHPIEPVVPAPDPLPGVTVTAIMGPNEARGTEALVFINGKVRRVGEEVSPGWRITAINARDWLVEFTHEDGRVEVIARDLQK